MGRGSSGAGARAKGARASKGAGGGGAGGSATAKSTPAGKFGPSKAKVGFASDTSPAEIRAAKLAAKKLFGDKFDVQDFASISGAPDNAKVVIDFLPTGNFLYGNGTPSFKTYVSSPEIGVMERSFSVNDRGQKVIYNEIFTAKTPGTGLGLKLFSRQVENATALGFKAIDTNAARSDVGVKFNGFSTWAKFGYNAKLPSEVRGQLPKELRGARSLHELRQTESGRQWWNKNGQSMDMRFNLAPGSRSQRVLKGYAADVASRPPRPTQ